MTKENLKFDFDFLNQSQIYNLFKDRAIWVFNFFKIKAIEIYAYKTNHGYHVYVHCDLKNTTDADIVFLQAVIGSDFMRECYYWKRIKYPKLPNRKWNILFYKKYYHQKSKKELSKEEFSENFTERLRRLFASKGLYE